MEDIEKICSGESDLSTKRNAFILLFNMDQNKALNYLKTIMSSAADEPLYEMGDIF